VLPRRARLRLDRGVYGPTNGAGDVGFGMGDGAYYWPDQGRWAASVCVAALRRSEWTAWYDRRDEPRAPGPGVRAVRSEAESLATRCIRPFARGILRTSRVWANVDNALRA